MADKDFVVKNGIVTGSNNATFGTAVTLASNGNVGIANTAPANKLVVTGSITATVNVSAASVNASTGFYGTVQTATQGTINHNSLANYSADQHVAHSTVSITAGNGLTGGGAIDASRTVSVSPGNTQLVANATGLWADQTKFDHNSLTNYVADRHVAHSTVSITAGNGLTGGGAIDASRTVSVSPGNNQLIANSTGLWADQTKFDHNSLTNYVADQHIAHSTVSITAGNGLSGGGTIAANRSLAVVAGTGIASNSTGVHVTNVPTAVTFNNGGAGVASGNTFNGNSAITVSYNTLGAPSTTGTNASGTWGISISGTAATATLATKASTLSAGGGNGTAMTFNWSGQSGQPSWLWGGSDGSNMYVYNPSNFSVNYATTSGATNQTSWSSLSTTSQLNAQGNQTTSVLTASTSLGGIMVQGANSTTAAFMSFHRPSAYASYFGLDTDNQFAVGGWSAGAALGNMKVGSFGVGTAASGTAGEIRATNDITAFYSSDESLKENVTPIKDALNKVVAINGVEFDWTDKYIEDHGGVDNYFMRKHDVGVIAQEIEKVLPEVVATRQDGIKAVKYDRIVALLIESIKELKSEIDDLKAKIGE